MKKKLLKLLSLLLLSSMSSSLFAQEEISTLLKSGIVDLNYIANGYLKPMGTGFAAGLGSNWYNTAAPHKLFGFDLTIGGGVAMVPTADQNFSLAGLKILSAPGGETSAPSFGGSGKGVTVALVQPTNIKDLNGNDILVAGQPIPNPEVGKTIVDFPTPDGIFNMVPTVNVQAAIGLPFGNEVAIRFVPSVPVSGFKLGLWGVGIKHDFKQWIPVVKEMPFDASLFVGYTKFSLTYEFPAANQIKPADVASDATSIIPYTGAATFDNQKIDMQSSALTVNVIVSKKLLFFTPFLGFGFTNSSFDLKLKGDYPLTQPYFNQNNLLDANNGKMEVIAKSNPVSISYSNMMPGATIGFRLKLLFIIALHAEYTLQKYPIASGGFGINFR
jgi:hypothetical protein